MKILFFVYIGINLQVLFQCLFVLSFILSCCVIVYAVSITPNIPISGYIYFTIVLNPKRLKRYPKTRGRIDESRLLFIFGAIVDLTMNPHDKSVVIIPTAIATDVNIPSDGSFSTARIRIGIS